MADTSVDFGNERSNAELADALARAALGEDSDDLDNDVFDFLRLAGYVKCFLVSERPTSNFYQFSNASEILAFVHEVSEGFPDSNLCLRDGRGSETVRCIWISVANA